MLDELLAYARDDQRVCPRPEQWNRLWQMLPDRHRLANGGWEPPAPLILAAWSATSTLAKMARLEEHIRYASDHGVLPQVDRYLRGLAKEEWARIGDL